MGANRNGTKLGLPFYRLSKPAGQIRVIRGCSYQSCSRRRLQGGDHDGFDGVHAVLGFVEDNAVLAAEDFVRDFADVEA